jgi:predicted dehydrogenase
VKKIKIGVFGVGRGTTLAKAFMLLGCDIVAVCDARPASIDDRVKSALPNATEEMRARFRTGLGIQK